MVYFNTGSDEPIVQSFFDVSFKGRLSDNNTFKPVTAEMAKQIMQESIDWFDKVYEPAEKDMVSKLGRPLTHTEQFMLWLELEKNKYK